MQVWVEPMPNENFGTALEGCCRRLLILPRLQDLLDIAESDLTAVRSATVKDHLQYRIAPSSDVRGKVRRKSERQQRFLPVDHAPNVVFAMEKKHGCKRLR